MTASPYSDDPAITLESAYLGNPFHDDQPKANEELVLVRYRYASVERYLTEGPDEAVILTFRGRASPGGDQPQAESDFLPRPKPPAVAPTVPHR